MANYKGIIRFISKEHSKWALVKQYYNSVFGDTAAEVARLSSTVAPNSSEKFLTLDATHYNVKITVDTYGPTDVDVTGNMGVTTTGYAITTIINNINVAVGSVVASKTGSGTGARILMRGAVASGSGVITIAAASSNSASALVFSATLPVTDAGVTGVDVYGTNPDGYRLVRSDFSGRSIGQQIEYNYDGYGNFNDGRNITIV